MGHHKGATVSAQSGPPVFEVAAGEEEAFGSWFLERIGHPLLVCAGPGQSAASHVLSYLGDSGAADPPEAVDGPSRWLEL